MASEGRSFFLDETLGLGETTDRTSRQPKSTIVTTATAARQQDPAEDELSRQLQRLAERSAQPVTSISTFMAAVTILNPPFKPRTLHRPWSISAGQGKHGAVEVHRYVPGRNFDVFNDSSPLKLRAYQPDPKRTGEYYAVKRLVLFNPDEDDAAAGTRGVDAAESSQQRAFALLGDELRILAHKDLRGHPNIVFLFGVSHTPPRSGGLMLAEPNLVLQEGDCGDLFSFYRDVDMRFNRQTLVEVKMGLLFDIACGLEALHRHGVVHCDLKPQNILIRRRHGRERSVQRCQSEEEAGQVAIDAMTGDGPFVAMLADFGGSLILSDGGGGNSDDNAMRPKLWTPLWAPPEFYSPVAIPKTLLPRADIYSAGLIFAFILCEGRDIFTREVHRGRMHQYDVTLSRDTVQDLKLSGAALDFAKQAVCDFEMSLFGTTTAEERIYMFRYQLYPPVLLHIFDEILELALQPDPSRRVGNAVDMLGPWKHALQQGNFIAESSEPCCVVPALGAASVDMRPGVFDIRKAFVTFRASLTSGLKTEILNDLLREVGLVQSIQRHKPASRRLQDIVPAAHLRRAADCAYQVGVACLEGFGRPRSDSDALKWFKLAAEWGSPSGQCEYLPLSEALLGAAESTQDEIAVLWAATAVGDHGRQNASKSLWRASKSLCMSAIKDFKVGYSGEIWETFAEATGLTKSSLFESGNLELLRLIFGDFDLSQPLVAESGWTILHYATFSGNLDAVKTLVEDLGADVRCQNQRLETPLDVAMGSGSVSMSLYLLGRHGLLQPPFKPGSCPLQCLAFIPAESIPDMVYQVLSTSDAPHIDVRCSATGRTALMSAMMVRAPLLPDAREAAISTLLAYGANPLQTAAERGDDPVLCSASPLLLSVLDVDYKITMMMLDAIREHSHVMPLLHQSRARPGPWKELARSFYQLMKTPRSVTLTRGSQTPKQAYNAMIESLLRVKEIWTELPYVCRHLEQDTLGLACYYGKDEALQLILEAAPESDSLLTKGTLTSVCGIDDLLTAITCGFIETIDLILPRLMVRKDIATYNILGEAVHHQPALVPQIYSHFEKVGKGPQVLEYVSTWGATALDLALEYNNFELAKYLLGKGATYDAYRLKGDHSIGDDKQSTLASVLPRMQPIRFLMELDPKPSLVVTSSGLNVFHVLATDEKLIGASVGRGELLDVLEYFYDLDPTLIHARGGAQGFTPFHLVSLYYSEVVGRFLRDRGANINELSSAAGLTPLDVLCLHGTGDDAQRDGGGQHPQLVVDFVGGAARTGVTICDYALAGPVYWVQEGKLATNLQQLYLEWGAKRSTEVVAEERASVVAQIRSLRILD